MSVVKAKYTRSKAGIKAHLRYITHRPGREGEKLSRLLFSYDYKVLDRQRVYEMIDNAPKGTKFYKIIISPDPKREDSRKDLDLWNFTEKTMNQLTKLLKLEAGQHVQFVGTVHSDHTDIRHVHTIVLVRGRLAREDFTALRLTATLEARRQRKRKDLARKFHARSSTRLSQSPTARRLPLGSVTVPKQGCPACGHKQSMVRLKNGTYWCRQCGRVEEQRQGLRV
jgi:ribosomal protein L37AE/L43A